MAGSGECAYMDWVRRRTPGGPRVLLGPGGGSPPNWAGGGPCLVTTGRLMEATLCPCRDRARVGRKAMAASGGDTRRWRAGRSRPWSASPCPNRRGKTAELCVGMMEVADEFEAAAVGGDTNIGQPAGDSVTVLGRGRRPRTVTRSGQARRLVAGRARSAASAASTTSPRVRKLQLRARRGTR